MAPKRKTIAAGEETVVKRSKNNEESAPSPEASGEAGKGKKHKAAGAGKKTAASKDPGAPKGRFEGLN